MCACSSALREYARVHAWVLTFLPSEAEAERAEEAGEAAAGAPVKRSSAATSASPLHNQPIDNQYTRPTDRRTRGRWLDRIVFPMSIVFEPSLQMSESRGRAASMA